jgi:hypothetical protein
MRLAYSVRKSEIMIESYCPSVIAFTEPVLLFDN